MQAALRHSGYSQPAQKVETLATFCAGSMCGESLFASGLRLMQIPYINTCIHKIVCILLHTNTLIAYVKALQFETSLSTTHCPGHVLLTSLGPHEHTATNPTATNPTATQYSGCHLRFILSCGVLSCDVKRLISSCVVLSCIVKRISVNQHY